MAYAENQITLEIVTDGGGGEGGAQIFTTQPTPPYNVGDLWVYYDTEEYDVVDSNNNNLIDSAASLFQAVR